MQNHFHQSQRVINNNVMLQQQLDHLLHVRRIGINGVRFRIHHHAGQILDMVNLVHAVFNSLNRVHAEWNVPGHGHAQPMRFSGNNFQDVRLH